MRFVEPTRIKLSIEARQLPASPAKGLKCDRRIMDSAGFALSSTAA